MGVGFAGLTDGLPASAFALSAIPKLVINLAPAELGVIAEVNDAFCRLAGHERDVLVGRPCRLSPVEPDDPPLAAVLAAGRTRADFAVVRPDGSRVPVVCHFVTAGSYAIAELVEGADPEAARLRTTIRVQQEITAAASDRDALLRLMTDRTFEVLPSAETCVVQLVDGDVLRNASGSGSLAGRDGPPAPLDRSLSGLAVTTRQVIRCDDTQTDPRANPARAKALNIGSMMAAPLYAGSGAPIGALLVGSSAAGAFHDGDEQQLSLIAHALGGALRHAEAVAALRISENRFRTQFAHSGAGQVICDLRGAFVEVNPAFARMLGYTVEQLDGLLYPDLMDPAGVVETQPLIDDLLTGQHDFFTQESRLRRADDRWITVDATVSLVRDHGGRPRHLIGVIVDSTDQRAAERARNQAADDLADRNDQLEAANRLKLDIIQMLGYEVRNPLAAIRGFAEVLADDWAGLDDAFRARAITAMARQSERLDEVVREVLARVSSSG